jgi:membrane-bound lytic murein transglycosylase D
MTFKGLLLLWCLGAPAETMPLPAALLPAVDFWTDLFLHQGHDRVLLHDRDHPQVVWQVLVLPRGKRGRIDERAAKRRVRACVAELRQRLDRLATGAPPADAQDRALWLRASGSTAAAPASPALLQGASSRLRTQRGVADDFSAGRRRAALYLRSMRSIFRRAGLPPDLALLPFVESMFNPRARSAAGAAGLWQLMPSTARGLGLRVERGLDERLGVHRSTLAAARLLRQNFKILGSWPLAITAYNHGAFSMQRATRALGNDDLLYLIDHYQASSWGFSSKNFYAEFLAVRRILGIHPDP